MNEPDLPGPPSSRQSSSFQLSARDRFQSLADSRPRLRYKEPVKSKSSARRSSSESTVPLSASAPIWTTYLLLSLALIQLLAACTQPELTRTDEVFSLVVAPAGDDNPRNSEGDIIVLKDGLLLLAYTEFLGSTSGDFEPARISARISSNGGKTWGKKLVLAENQEGLKNAMIASLLRLADGRIMLGYNKKVSRADTRFYVRFSEDEGSSWSQEVSVIASPAYGAVYNFAPIQLDSGRILAPYSYSPDYNRENHFKVRVYYSDDGGAGWNAGETDIDLPKRGAMEPGLVELGDGSVLMHLRTQLGRVYECRSRDEGLTWTDPAPTSLLNPESPIATARIPSTGDLLVVFNNNYDPEGPHHLGARRPLTTAISRDGGKTWQHFKNIEDDPEMEYSYPSITFSEERVLLSYYRAQGQGEAARLDQVFTSLPIGWLYP